MKRTIIVVVLLLAGCSSDVDKCVDAQMKSWELDAKQKTKMYVGIGDGGQILTREKTQEDHDQLRAAAEAVARVRCK